LKTNSQLLGFPTSIKTTNQFYSGHDCSRVLTQTKHMHFGVETHLSGGVMSAFVFRWQPLLEHPALMLIGSSGLRKGPWRFWLHWQPHSW